MKRTDREKDWPFITSLGVALLHGRDPRGWLHLYDADSMLELLEAYAIPKELLALRPSLELAIRRDPVLPHALLAEQHFWKELDRLRIRLCRAALRPYVVAMGRTDTSNAPDLKTEHQIRVACAESTLAPNPIGKHGVERMIADARTSTAAFVNPELIRWLPDVRPYFKFLTP
jgi:hypothetical protein